MAKKADELIEKPVVSKRGRPRKTDTATKKSTKKSSKKVTSKKQKTKKVITPPVSESTKNEVKEPIVDASLIASVAPSESISIVEPITSQQPKKKRTIKNISVKKSSNETTISKKANKKRTLSLSLPRGTTSSTSAAEDEIKQEPETLESFEETISELPEETQVHVIPEVQIKQETPKKKRNLRLNSGFTKKIEINEEPLPSIQEKIIETSLEKEVAINQNSSFFNSPSVFTKFNIDFTSTELEELQEKETEGLNDLIDSSTLSDTSKLLEFFKNNVSSNKKEDVYDFVSVEESPTLENTTQTLTAEEYDFVSTEINNSIYNLDSTSNIENVDTELDINLNDILIDALDIELDDTQSEEFNIISDTNTLVEDVIELDNTQNETIESETLDDSDDKIIDELNEEFTDDDILEEILNSDNILDSELFDAAIINVDDLEINSENESIIDISENINNDTNQLTKEAATNIIEEHIGEKIEYIADKCPAKKFIENPFFTSSIFKKFTFEEASFAATQNNKEIYNNSNITLQPESNLSTIQNTLENFTPNLQDVSTPITNAEPISTINIPTIEQTITSTPTVPVETVDNYASISPSSSLDSYEDDFEDPENYQFSNKLINKLSEEEIDDTDENDNDNDNFESINKKFQEIDYDKITSEDLEKLQEINYNDDTFSVESYFGLEESTKNIEPEIQLEKESLITETTVEENDFAEKFLNANKQKTVIESTSSTNTEHTDDIDVTDLDIDDIDINDFDLDILEDSIFEETELSEDNIIENSLIEEELENVFEDFSENTELDINDIDINDLDLNDFEDLEISNSTETLDSSEKSVESIISEAFLSKDFSLDSTLTNKLLLEVNSDQNTTNNENLGASSDFLQIINSLTKAITELEQTPDVNSEVYVKPEPKQIKQTVIKESKKEEKTPLSSIDLPTELISNTQEDDKAINILINKDDIFSISILNETYEIVADFDGISVLSENIHISTPKNNFFVKVGNKYIEIHNKETHFILNTNFEDIEFANAINNITFAKKDNKIELNIKEAFKLSSVNNKIEVSMLNKAIADLSSTSNTSEPSADDSSSICDNKTLLISEETQKVYLPYTIEDVMKKLKTTDDYQTLQEVIDNEYTLPLSTFKMPIISRFKEAYRFMRTKENSSVYAAVDLALELMFNSNLNPAVIRAAKDLKELNIYLDCLYENEVEKFDCFKIIYKVLPKIK